MASSVPPSSTRDLIGIHDGRNPLGDDDDRRMPGDGPERRAQPRLGAEIERREGLVEEIDLGLAHQRAGDRQALALAA